MNQGDSSSLNQVVPGQSLQQPGGPDSSSFQGNSPNLQPQQQAPLQTPTAGPGALDGVTPLQVVTDTGSSSSRVSTGQLLGPMQSNHWPTIAGIVLVLLLALLLRLVNSKVYRNR
jgi:hypothetical protein